MSWPGGSAFFAALGPVLGGLLTAISWRLVFLINVPLTLAVIALTLAGTPALAADSEQRRRIDWVGTGVFAVAIVALIYGPSRGQPDGWSSPETVVPLAVCVIAFVVLGWVERRAADPLIEFRLFRHLNFLASTISQVLAGALELGLGYLLPAGASRDHLGSGVRRPAGQCPRFQSVLAGRCRGFVGTRRRTTAALATSLPLPVMAALALAASLLLRRGHSARIGVS